ncbi:MAG: sugar phosphate isomerase/epimerase [Planctomycetota bacterium]|nr:sugar phosphate isomerase/epimerase [Planctomycetota bacterium]
MKSKTTWKLGFNAFWWDGLDREPVLDGCIGSLVDMGYQAVEFKVDSFGSQLNRDAIVRAAQKAEAAKLAVSNLVILRSLSQAEGRQQAVEDVSEAIRICAAAGIGALNIVSGAAAQVPAYPPESWWRSSTRPDPAAWEMLTQSVHELVKVAEAEGVDLALEACGGSLVCDFGTTLELLARCDHPRMKLTFDPSHYILAGQDVGVAIRRLGPRIRHVHLKDAVGRRGAIGEDFLFPLLGQGATDWPVFFQALRDVSYTGVLSVEFESFRLMEEIWQRDAVQAARLSKQAADRLIELYGQGVR